MFQLYCLLTHNAQLVVSSVNSTALTSESRKGLLEYDTNLDVEPEFSRQPD